MSGYCKSRFVGLTDGDFDELMCGICLCVFRDPIETNCCRKTFCNECIQDWIKRTNTCPNDRKRLNRNDLIGSSKIVLSLLSRLKIKCEFSDNGCPKVVSLDALAKHVGECNYNKCKYCGETMADMNDHNCEQSLKIKVNQLRSNNKFLNQRIHMLQSKTSKLESTLRKHRIIICFKCGEEGHKVPQCSVGSVRNKAIKQQMFPPNTNEKSNEILTVKLPIKRNQQTIVSNQMARENLSSFARNAETSDDNDYVIIEEKMFNCKFCRENVSHAEIYAHMETMHRQRLCPICSTLFDLTVAGAEIYLQMHVENHFDEENRPKQCQKQDAQTPQSKVDIEQTTEGVVAQFFKKLFN